MHYVRLHHAFYEIAHKHDWSNWASDYRGWNVPEAYKTGVKAGDLVIDVLDAGKETRDDRYGDGYGSGSEADHFILFKVTFPDGAELFYRKKGVFDSYGEERWDGSFEEVVATEKKITVYEIA